MQPVVEQRPNGENTTARQRPGFQNDDRYAGLVKKISCAQAGETRADDHNGGVDIERTRGDASHRCRGERKRSRGLLKKSSAIHILLFVRHGRRAVGTAASWRGKSGRVKEDRRGARAFCVAPTDSGLCGLPATQ
jgi:hypothetical protein